MRLSITILSLAMLAIPSAAENGNYIVRGTGTESCAAWLATTYSETAGADWVLGFWTGVSVGVREGKGGKVGSTTDNLGIIGEIKKRCMTSPSAQLERTALDVFVEFLKAKK